MYEVLGDYDEDNLKGNAQCVDSWSLGVSPVFLFGLHDEASGLLK